MFGEDHWPTSFELLVPVRCRFDVQSSQISRSDGPIYSTYIYLHTHA